MSARVEKPDFIGLLAFSVLVARMGPGIARFFEGLSAPVLRRLYHEWAWQAHGGQEEPKAPGWRIWLMMAGRGFGKTLAGAQWVTARAREHPDARIALVGETHAEVVRTMIEGPSGLLAVARPDEPVRWEPTRRIVTFASGAQAFPFSARAAEALRGPEHDFAWCDELAKWKKQGDAAWDNLQMGLRRGTWPRTLVTTTPRNVPLLKRVRALKGVAETNGRTEENPHVAEPFRAWAKETYGGTRLGRQELDGMLFEDVEGALWTREILERARVLRYAASTGSAPTQDERDFYKRVVVGVDPPASAEGDACGIVVCGLGRDDIAYVLADCSVSGLRPEGWARAVVGAAEAWGADRVVAEKNQGGDMVESVLRTVEAALPLRPVSAVLGKAARAEPIAARFESGKTRLAGRFPELEDEMAGMQAGGGYEGPGSSPDRVDALVWAMTELVRPRAEPRVTVF